MGLFEGTSAACKSLQHLKGAHMHLELTEGANTVISFYSSSLVSCVGPQFKPPSLDFLARQWFDASSMGLEVTSWLVTDAVFVLDELRQAIRILFDASVANLSDEEAIKITERWQHHGKQSFHQTCFNVNSVVRFWSTCIAT